MTDSTTQHTPGPWVLQDNAGFGVYVYGAGGAFGGGVQVAKVQASVRADVQTANAHLIAAAPDLLAALREMVRTCRPTPIIEAEGRDALTAARAAIARAEGRS